MKIFLQTLTYLLITIGYSQNTQVNYYVDHGVTDFHGQKIENGYDSSLTILGTTSFYTPTSEVKEREDRTLLLAKKMMIQATFILQTLG